MTEDNNMSAVVAVHALEQLSRFLNEKGVLEIVLRGEGQKIKQIVKVAIDKLPQEKAVNQQMFNKLMNALQNANIMGQMNLAANAVNNAIGMKSLKMLASITKLNQFNLFLSGVNLCATVVGFALVVDKLNHMSAKIDEVFKAVKSAQMSHIQLELDTVLANHRNMLYVRENNEPYSKNDMRKLADDETNILNMLISVFLDSSVIDESLLVSIYSLASMLAISVMYCDEAYYFSSKEQSSGGNKWHPSHAAWMAVFDRILSDEFVMRIQDYGMLELGLNTEETDLYYKSLCAQIVGLKEEIENNQALIQAFDDKESFKKYRELLEMDVRETVMQIFESAGISTDDPEIANALNQAFAQIAVV